MAENKAIQKVTTNEIRSFLQNSKASLANYTGGDCKIFLRSALIAIENDENLSKCLETPAGQASLYNAMKHGATTGLSLNPFDGEACLIAYEGKNGWIINYQVQKNGFIELAYRTNRVKSITADVVRENDEFEVIKTGGQDKYKHIPARKNRGEIDGYYAVLTLNDGQSFIEYATNDEIEKHALTYSAQYARYVNSDKKGQVPIWVKSKSGMGIKTVLKALLRKNRISTAASNAVSVDDTSESQIIDIIPDNPERKSYRKGKMSIWKHKFLFLLLRSHCGLRQWHGFTWLDMSKPWPQCSNRICRSRII
jgi:recombination protein RecT